MNILIKKVASNDYGRIFELSSLLDNSEEDKGTKIRRAIESGLVWIAKDNDIIIGFCLVELFDSGHDQLPDSIFISELYVLELYRNQGVGKQLVRQVLNTKFPDQYKYFSLSHDPEEGHLTDFYKSLGFEVVGKTKGGNVKMIKNI